MTEELTDGVTLEPEHTDKPVMELPPLTLADRCDRCGSQAFVRAVMPGGGDLLFCAHHGAEYEAKLRQVAVHIQDERDKINPKPSVSAVAD